MKEVKVINYRENCNEVVILSRYNFLMFLALLQTMCISIQERNVQILKLKK